MTMRIVNGEPRWFTEPERVDWVDWDAEWLRDRERTEAERKERVIAEAKARDDADEDRIFALIQSHDAGERLDGYRRHLDLLGRRHRWTVVYHESSGGHAGWRSRIIHGPHIRSEEAAAVHYHEGGHLLAGECPNDGAVHRRDPSVHEWWHCVACETAATSRALQLAPFTRPMFDRLAGGLRSYRAGTPAPQREIEKLDALAGTITFAEHQSKWRKWQDRVERQRRVTDSLRRSSTR
jgi:hypothetical protein